VGEKAPTCGAFAEPSDGLEPPTPRSDDVVEARAGLGERALRSTIARQITAC
jgi:hypothetical protein